MRQTKNSKDENLAIEQWMLQSRLFRIGQKLQDEINKHKWVESEKAGYDIGWHRAHVNWTIQYGSQQIGCMRASQDTQQSGPKVAAEL